MVGKDALLASWRMSLNVSEQVVVDGKRLRVESDGLDRLKAVESRGFAHAHNAHTAHKTTFAFVSIATDATQRSKYLSTILRVPWKYQHMSRV
ncbi:hypothetical protein H257_14802 [Aphanomyces astaci]|uniref:Uncharacterized protein n=1 Tax=Aphanomyces astaci TaxID=112090 RepID=W4FRJ9_APHAT|nr:hypothetical protein H257_14802 [Aphanomyces astaci]ETV69566.1 hypothetical protein H257_14802 [Aphanomyces astaci]|eukprot:XP_009840990.1 hypothetical protein H257_14802 [Aphanomyces astaci]